MLTQEDIVNTLGSTWNTSYMFINSSSFRWKKNPVLSRKNRQHQLHAYAWCT